MSRYAKKQMTLGDLKKAISKLDSNLENNSVLLIRKHPGTRNKIMEFIYSGSIIIFDKTEIKREK